MSHGRGSAGSSSVAGCSVTLCGLCVSLSSLPIYLPIQMIRVIIAIIIIIIMTRAYAEETSFVSDQPWDPPSLL
jgi:hypothetical protein